MHPLYCCYFAETAPFLPNNHNPLWNSHLLALVFWLKYSASTWEWIFIPSIQKIAQTSNQSIWDPWGWKWGSLSYPELHCKPDGGLLLPPSYWSKSNNTPSLLPWADFLNTVAFMKSSESFLLNLKSSQIFQLWSRKASENICISHSRFNADFSRETGKFPNGHLKKNDT